MRTKVFIFLVSLFFVAFLLIQIQTPITTNSQVSTAEVTEAAKQHLVEAYGKLPLAFEENRGQTDPEVNFLSRGNGYTLFLTSGEAVLSLQISAGNSKDSEKTDTAQTSTDGGDAQPAEPAVIRMGLVGANPEPEVSGVEELPGKSNYFIGNDPAKWRTNVLNYAKVEYRDVYPSVDLTYYGNQRQLEYDFIVSPGGDPESIRLSFEGVDDLTLDSEGNLILHTVGGEVIQQAPIIYQEVDGIKKPIAGGYVLHSNHQVGFEVGDYDASKTLVIDPVLVYSTYLGGSGDERSPVTRGVSSIAVDADGNA